MTSRGREIFEIGADEVPAVTWSKYVKVTVVRAKMSKNGNHGTTFTSVFSHVCLIIAKTMAEDRWLSGSNHQLQIALPLGRFQCVLDMGLLHTVCRFTVSHET